MKIFVLIICLTVGSHTLNAADLTFGYVPLSFPRDPIEFNQFDEHVVYGQIVEPLIDADGDGRIVPGVAKEWKFSKDGKRITFKIDTQLKFSNGSFVKSSDVVYSITRHLKSKSQSKYFLSDISTIKAEGKDSVVVLLAKRNPAILKALTRDQLGIIPEGWTFKLDSNDPFVGTGPYVLKKENNKWLLDSNQFYQKHEVPIKKWRLIFYSDASLNLPSEIPDVVPVVNPFALDQIKKNPLFKVDEFMTEPTLGFTQTSFWIHPKGKFYLKIDQRKVIQSAFNEIVDEFCLTEGLTRATGLIPKGIQGSLDSQMILDKGKRFEKPTVVRIASLRGSFSRLFSPENLTAIRNRYNIDIDLKFFTFVEMAAIQDFGPDIITGSWAGGYNDPTGFMALLGPLLGQDFKTYLNPSVSAQLMRAESEQEFSKRAAAFKLFGQEILKQAFLIPGWRVNTTEVHSNIIQKQNFQVRYTPRLINFRKVK